MHSEINLKLMAWFYLKLEPCLIYEKDTILKVKGFHEEINEMKRVCPDLSSYPHNLPVLKMSHAVWHDSDTSKNKSKTKTVFWESFPLAPGGRNNFHGSPRSSFQLFLRFVTLDKSSGPLGFMPLLLKWGRLPRMIFLSHTTVNFQAKDS